ncbi:MAG: tetratricopeptide repeat protein, partial [Hyphomicrobiales bacterium]|nr:tetratricopeptide repeat protein [Hyphomicrobiales bacterium]
NGVSREVTGAIGPSTQAPGDPSGLADFTARWQARYDSNPGDPTASIMFARALRKQGRFGQAVAVMETALAKSPKDETILGEYGKALADKGDFAAAADALSRSYTPDRPRWDILTAQGSVADQAGDHASAQDFYRRSLAIRPGEPSTLADLGLSLALTKRLPAAEAALRQAAAGPGAGSRIRSDFALVLALEGKFGEARSVFARDMPPAEADRDVAAVRAMISQSEVWRGIGKKGA